MLNKVLGNKIFIFIVSLILACVLWGYVVNVVNEEISVSINNIRVTFEGAQELKETRSLQIIESQVGTVNLSFTGKRSDISKIKRDNIGVTVDLSSIRNSGEFSLAYSVNLPDGLSEDQVSIVRSPYYVRVIVVKMVFWRCRSRANWRAASRKLHKEISNSSLKQSECRGRTALSPPFPALL